MSKLLKSINIWEDVWTDSVSEDYRKQVVEFSKRSVLYRKIEMIVKSNFQSFNNVSAIELGCGEAIFSLLLSMLGVYVTCVDFSKAALSRAKAIFDFYGLSANFIEANILDLPADFMNKYDISISAGVAEHFTGKEREDIFKAHLSVLKPNGLAMVTVPNARCVPYRIMKYLMEKTGRWILGTEIPFSRKELTNIAERFSEVKTYKIFGDSFYRTFYTNLFVPARILLGKMFNIKTSPFLAYKVVNERESIFDDYLGNMIALAMWRN